MNKFSVSPYWAATIPGTKIYALLDPGNGGRFKRGDIRYIGSTTIPEKRLRIHWSNRLRNQGSSAWWTPRNKWLRSLGAPPEMIIMAVLEHDDECIIENAYIDWAIEKFGPKQMLNKRLNGHNIVKMPKQTPEHTTNMANGIRAAWAKRQGEDRKHSPEHRAAIGEAMRRLHASDPDFKARSTANLKRGH